MLDFDELIAGMHARGIKFIMDVVVNHSSDEHEWFKQSRSSRDNPYRDYYHWWPAEKGTPPYRYSLFDPEGNAWQYDSTTNAYYLHYFSEKQPDLKWENPKVRQEVFDIMKFWAGKGVDGFRLDAFQFVSKDTTYPVYPEGFEKNFIDYYGMGPNLHAYLREMYDEVLGQYDVFAVSEGSGSTFEDAHDLVDAERNELQMAYHFKGIDVGSSLDRYTLEEFRNVYSQWDSAFAEKGWLSIFLANHDQPRMTSKYGNDSAEFRTLSNKMLNTFVLSMRGTPYCYYGDELGMTNIDFGSIEEIRDNATRNSFIKAVNEGADPGEEMRKINFLSRDNGRTPMQWDAGSNANFTSGTPWMPVNENHLTINVESHHQDPNSCLNYFRKMVQLRKENPVLVYGDYELVDGNNSNVYAYTRTLDDQAMLVVLNFSEKSTTVDIPGNLKPGEALINNYNLSPAGTPLVLQPYQAVIFQLE